MTKRFVLSAVTCCWLVAALATTGWTLFKPTATGENMTAAAQAYLKTLDKDQTATSLMDYDTEQRIGWHFIPKDHRKGLQIKHMNAEQRKAALALLNSALSKVGYDKARKIMELEAVLHELEKAKPGGNIRDPERYYYTVFGKPAEDARWGLSIEGHHLSLNFVVEDNEVISSTPTFFAANPTVIKKGMGDVMEVGTRVLAKEETLAFKLVQSLDDGQRQKAIIADEAPREIRAAGEPQSPPYSPDGIAIGDLNDQQTKTLKMLIGTYARNLPDDVAKARLKDIREAGEDKIHFAWAGPDKPGIGHYYRIQGPSFVIEFVNTQPDAAGNPASHIHCVWRDPRGDFAIPAGKAS